MMMMAVRSRAHTKKIKKIAAGVNDGFSARAFWRFSENVGVRGKRYRTDR
jgi:hypothetical protein